MALPSVAQAFSYCSLRRKGGRIMPLSKEKKAEIIAEYGKDANDSGSAEVQVALLTQRIRDLTEHLKIHQKDHHTRRGLLMLVGKRRRLLTYIKRNDIQNYRDLIARLGIRDNI
jgi:small subunit ribosomal protein S15